MAADRQDEDGQGRDADHRRVSPSLDPKRSAHRTSAPLVETSDQARDPSRRPRRREASWSRRRPEPHQQDRREDIAGDPNRRTRRPAGVAIATGRPDAPAGCRPRRRASSLPSHGVSHRTRPGKPATRIIGRSVCRRGRARRTRHVCPRRGRLSSRSVIGRRPIRAERDQEDRAGVEELSRRASVPLARA